VDWGAAIHRDREIAAGAGAGGIEE
jgi:hypothetical protein